MQKGLGIKQEVLITYYMGDGEMAQPLERRLPFQRSYIQFPYGGSQPSIVGSNALFCPKVVHADRELIFLK